MQKKSSSQTIIQLAIPTPLYKYFDYLPPKVLERDLKPGMRVLAPFGRRKLVGIVVGTSQHSQIEREKLRAIETVLDQEPILDSELFELASWAQRYYHFPIGETFNTLLPSLLRQGLPAETSAISLWRVKEGVDQTEASSLHRSPIQLRLFQHLLNHKDGLKAEQLQAQHKHWRRAVNALCEKTLIEKITQDSSIPKNTITASAQAKPSSNPPLNHDQATAINTISEKFGCFNTWLLEGVTGSGKTEVYIQLIERVVSQKLQVLVLIPEIGLSPQLLTRFKNRLNARIAVLHSGLNDRERLNSWLFSQRGAVDVIIGTRSAVFTPLANPGLIIIDEEHDNSFKQQEGLRYHARDLAVFRANKLNIPIILGSATPSLESLNNVQQGRYQYLSLPKRASSAKQPRLSVIDMRKSAVNEAFSVPLIETMQKHLEQKQQVLLFLNRRGYSPTLICNDCGWTSACHRCDAQMTFHHHRKQLQCHHCGTERRADQNCPECQSENLFPLGAGTERIESQIEKIFKDKCVVRIDRDTTRRKGELEKSLHLINSGKADILIGTQMLAKGHHFPKVTLVGIIDIDQGLFSADFRGPEYMAQLIIQVAGRAGRQQISDVGALPSEVLIQTHQPEHPLLKTLITQGYPEFAKQTLLERQTADLPPFAHIALLRTESTVANKGFEVLNIAKETLTQQNLPSALMLGPAPAPMEKRAGRYRAHLMLQANNRRELHSILSTLTHTMSTLAQAKSVRWSIDVDPMEMF